MSETRNGPRNIAQESASDEVGRLLLLAGHRPAVPAEDAAIVKAAARAEWRRTVAAERRRTFTLRGAGALLAVAAALLVVLNLDSWRRAAPLPVVAVATLETATGRVMKNSAELRPGDPIVAGSVLETGSPGRVALRLAGGASLRLDVDTRLRLDAESRLTLDRGAVYVDSGAEVGPLAISTPLGVVSDVGTRFEVRLDGGGDTLRVRVRDGEVLLDRGEEPAATAGEGDELTVLADGTLVAGSVVSYGPSWDWVLAIPPAFEAEGRSIAEFLEWVAREGGWQLRVAEQAAPVLGGIVHGDVAGLEIEEAAALVLTASGLGYRLEDGVFLVEPAG